MVNIGIEYIQVLVYLVSSLKSNAVPFCVTRPLAGRWRPALTRPAWKLCGFSKPLAPPPAGQTRF